MTCGDGLAEGGPTELDEFVSVSRLDSALKREELVVDRVKQVLLDVRGFLEVLSDPPMRRAPKIGRKQPICRSL